MVLALMIARICTVLECLQLVQMESIYLRNLDMDLMSFVRNNQLMEKYSFTILNLIISDKIIQLYLNVQTM
jgi:hypothetical protein